MPLLLIIRIAVNQEWIFLILIRKLDVDCIGDRRDDTSVIRACHKLLVVVFRTDRDIAVAVFMDETGRELLIEVDEIVTIVVIHDRDRCVCTFEGILTLAAVERRARTACNARRDRCNFDDIIVTGIGSIGRSWMRIKVRIGIIIAINDITRTRDKRILPIAADNGRLLCIVVKTNRIVAAASIDIAKVTCMHLIVACTGENCIGYYAHNAVVAVTGLDPVKIIGKNGIIIKEIIGVFAATKILITVDCVAIIYFDTIIASTGVYGILVSTIDCIAAVLCIDQIANHR